MLLCLLLLDVLVGSIVLITSLLCAIVVAVRFLPS